MTKPASRRLFAVTTAVVVAATALLYACRDQSVEPGTPDAAAAARGKGKFTLTLQGDGQHGERLTGVEPGRPQLRHQLQRGPADDQWNLLEGHQGRNGAHDHRQPFERGTRCLDRL